MVETDLLRSHFERGLSYAEYASSGTDAQTRNWAAFYDNCGLSDGQRSLVARFGRKMPVLVSSGLWCGDCVQQCPIFARIAEANPGAIDLRFVDRDEHSELAERIKICGGLRVPVVVFMNEDYEFVSLLGDRSLTRYRAIAQRQLGAACALPGATVPADEVAATVQDWVDEFERVQLLLRLSTKLRQRHGD